MPSDSGVPPGAVPGLVQQLAIEQGQVGLFPINEDAVMMGD